MKVERSVQSFGVLCAVKSDSMMQSAAASIRQKFNNLTFDNMTPDTSLAKDYLSKTVGSVSAIKSEEGESKDRYGNKILSSLPVNVEIVNDLDRAVFKKIADSVTKNSKLISQLDYLIRGTDIEDVLNYDVPIIVNTFLEYAKSGASKSGATALQGILIKKTKPLAYLGFTALSLHHYGAVELYADADVAVICSLFREICVEAGVPKEAFNLHVGVKDKLVTKMNQSTVLKENGCVVVVSEKADIESAVTSIVAATSNPIYPWRVQRIFVQHNVYEKFQSVLSRIAVDNVKAGPHIDVYRKKSLNVYAYSNKVFLIDFCDDIANLEDVTETSFIFVEAYRTTKELLSIISKKQTDYLSLWCNDISIANEIAYGSKAFQIWINDFGKLYSHKTIANVLFAEIDIVSQLENDTEKQENDVLSLKIDEVLKLRAAWIKKDFQQRKELMHGVLSEKNKEKVLEIEQKSSADLSNGKSCVTIDVSFGLAVVRLENNDDNGAYVENVIASTLHGNAFILENVDESLTKKFESIGIPILSMKSIIDWTALPKNHHISRRIVLNCKDLFFQPKSVYFRYGETFAN